MHASTLTVVFYETAKDLIFHAEKKNPRASCQRLIIIEEQNGTRRDG